MKLSEMNTEKAFDVMCDILPHVGAIASDEAFTDQLKQLANTKEDGLKSVAQQAAFVATAVSDFATLLLKNHREDAFAILAALNDKTVPEIKAQRIAETIKQIKEVATDPDLIALFK